MVAYDCPVRGCIRTRPGNRLVCGACEADLARALADIPWLAAHLELTRTRQTRSGHDGAAGSERPVPWDDRASTAAARLAESLRQWAATVSHAGPYPYEPACEACAHESCAHVRRWRRPQDTTTAGLARWLLGLTGWLLSHHAVPAMCADIGEAVHDAELAVDRPPEAWYAGPCNDCGTDMYADPTASMVYCRTPGCGASCGVSARREWLLAAAHDTLATATLIAQALTALDRRLTPDRIWQWAHRGRIIARGTDQLGRPIYRVGDVMDLQDELAAKLAAQEAARHARNAKIAT